MSVIRKKRPDIKRTDKEKEILSGKRTDLGAVNTCFCQFRHIYEPGFPLFMYCPGRISVIYRGKL